MELETLLEHPSLHCWQSAEIPDTLNKLISSLFMTSEISFKQGRRWGFVDFSVATAPAFPWRSERAPLSKHCDLAGSVAAPEGGSQEDVAVGHLSAQSHLQINDRTKTMGLAGTNSSGVAVSVSSSSGQPGLESGVGALSLWQPHCAVADEELLKIHMTTLLRDLHLL